MRNLSSELCLTVTCFYVHVMNCEFTVGLRVIIYFYYLTCVDSQYNAHSDWLILRHHSHVMTVGQLWTSKNQAKSHMIYYLLTSNVQPLQKNLKTQPWLIHYG